MGDQTKFSGLKRIADLVTILRVVLVQRSCVGKELRLNYRTAKDGWIKVELVRQPETPPKPVAAYEGFGLEEAETLAGDELDRVVRWCGKGD